MTAQFTDLNSTGFFRSTATINITSETEAEKVFDIVVNTYETVCQNSLGYNVRLQIKDNNVPIFSSDNFKVIVIKPTTYTAIEDYTLTSDGPNPVLNLAFNFNNPSGCAQTAKYLKVIPLSSGVMGEEFGYSEPTPDRNPTFSVRFKNTEGGAIAPGTYYFSFELYDGNIRTRMGIFDKLATVTNVPIVITSTAMVDDNIGDLFLDTSSSGQRYYHYSQYGGYYWLVNVPNKDAEHLKFDITASDEGLHFDRAEIVWHTASSFRINFWLTDSPTAGSHQFYIKISATDASGQWVQLLDRTESVSY